MAKEFEDSLEATEFMEQLQSMLKDERLLEWAKITDYNYGTRSTPKLVEVSRCFDTFLQTMYDAE